MNGEHDAGAASQQDPGFCVAHRKAFSFFTSPEAQVIGKQLLRCGTSVGANYRAVCRSRSKAEFIAKLGIVVEEADESAFWLELLIKTGTFKKEQVEGLLNEAQQLTALFNASRTTTRRS